MGICLCVFFSVASVGKEGSKEDFDSSFSLIIWRNYLKGFMQARSLVYDNSILIWKCWPSLRSLSVYIYSHWNTTLL